jgi:hypothetical protein
VYDGIQDGDETAIYDSSQGLATLQRLYGLFPRIVGKGDQAAVCAAFCVGFRLTNAPLSVSPSS